MVAGYRYTGVRCFIENGSGLSRRTRISARSLAMLLQHIVKSQYQPELFASLPLVGVDGTAKKLVYATEIPPGYARNQDRDDR